MAPDAFDPQHWADYLLIQDYWPAIKAKMGPQVGEAFQSVYTIDYSPTGNYVAVSGCDKVKMDMIDMHTPAMAYCEADLGGAVKVANAYAFILDARTGEIVATLPPTGTQTTVQCLQFSHDGKSLAYGTNSAQLAVWDIASGSIESEIPQAPSILDWFPHCAAFSPDDRIMAVNYGTFTKIWDRASKTFLANILEPGWPYALFSADGKTLQLGAPPDIYYRTSDWTKISSMWDTGYDNLEVADYSPDLTLEADEVITASQAGQNEPIRIFNTMTGKIVQTLEGKWHNATMLKFTPDGRYLLRLGDPVGQLDVWEVDGWKHSDLSSVLQKMVKPADVYVSVVLFPNDARSVLLWSGSRIALWGLP
jgi:WD40 repeat protein